MQFKICRAADNFSGGGARYIGKKSPLFTEAKDTSRSAIFLSPKIPRASSGICTRRPHPRSPKRRPASPNRPRERKYPRAGPILRQKRKSSCRRFENRFDGRRLFIEKFAASEKLEFGLSPALRKIGGKRRREDGIVPLGQGAQKGGFIGVQCGFPTRRSCPLRAGTPRRRRAADRSFHRRRNLF